MSDDRAFDRALDDWLADGSDRTPRPAVEAVLLAVKTTPQERDLRIPWRIPTMSLPLRLAAGIALVAIIGFATLTAFRPGTGSGTGAGPSLAPTTAPSPTPSPTAAPSSSPNPIDTSTWTTYHSKLYGFDIGHPADLPFDGAPDHVWTLAKDSPTAESTALENFYGRDAVNGDVRISAWSAAVEPGTTLEAWISAYCPQNAEPCTGIQDRAVAVYAGKDRHPGLLVPFTEDAYAFFLDNDRIYVVAVWRPEADPSVARFGGSRRLLEAFASTLSLGTSAPAATSPAPS